MILNAKMEVKVPWKLLNAMKAVNPLISRTILELSTCLELMHETHSNSEVSKFMKGHDLASQGKKKQGLSRGILSNIDAARRTSSSSVAR